MKNISILIISILISVSLAYSISEKFFFERFFEEKSIAHGYWPKDQNLSEADFGERGIDIVHIRETSEDNNQITNNSDVRIAFISDSFGWGNGVRFKNTVSQQLEKKLANAGISNTVLSLSMGGDSILDHLAKVDILEKSEKIDVFVFLIVNNDLLLRPSDNFYPSNVYSEVIAECQLENPDDQVVRHPPWDSIGNNGQEEVYSRYLKSFEGISNKCIFEKSLDRIKEKLNDRAIFVISDYNEEKDGEWSFIINILNEHKIEYINPAKGKELTQYSKCWQDKEALKKCFWVTKNDSHPSPKLHQMYSELLIDYLENSNNKPNIEEILKN